MYLTFHYGPFGHAKILASRIGISDESAKSLLIASPSLPARLDFVRENMHRQAMELAAIFENDKVQKGSC